MEKIRFLVLVVSGLSDAPMEQLGGKTPLEAARCPNLDALSARGRLGLVEIVGEEGSAGSDRALFSLLGYDPDRYPIRRGPLEAAGLEVPLEEDDLAFRFNFVSTFNGTLADHNAGQISGAEAATLVKMLNARLGDDRVRFHAGVGYRNLLVIKGGKGLDVTTVPPQEALHQPVVDFMPYGRDAEMLADLMRRAHEILKEHDINRVRIDLGENPADMVWPWGEGTDFEVPPFGELFPLSGCIVSAVPLLWGIARKIGFKPIRPSGSTGYVDTDYASKARETLHALREHDLVLLHVSAVNEVCHQENPGAKVRAIEAMDEELLGRIIAGLSGFEKWRVMVITDHVTPARESPPLKWPVPVAICGHEVEAVRGLAFTEANARSSDLFVERGPDLMEFFLRIPRGGHRPEGGGKNAAPRGGGRRG